MLIDKKTIKYKFYQLFIKYEGFSFKATIVNPGKSGLDIGLYECHFTNLGFSLKRDDLIKSFLYEDILAFENEKILSIKDDIRIKLDVLNPLKEEDDDEKTL